MKKTQKTMLTSAILSMAAATVAIVPDANAIQTDTSSAMAPLYGPPPSYTHINGDINSDGKVDIIDACMIKSTSEGNGFRGIEVAYYDVNKDSNVNELDFRAVRNYFLGITPDLLSQDPTPAITTRSNIQTTQPVYGTYATTTQPVYGPPVTSVTQPETSVTQPEPPVTNFTQPVYGPPVTVPEN